jgi:hypothetical protein
MLLQDLDNTINQLLNLSRYNRSPDEKTVAINIASMEYFKQLAGPVGDYSMGRPVPRTNFQETSTEYSLLSNFYKVINGSGSLNTGICPVTRWTFSDVVQGGPMAGIDRIYDVKTIEAVWVKGGQGAQVKILPDNQVRIRIASKLVPPSTEVPIGEYYPQFTYAIYPEAIDAIAKILFTPQVCKIVYDSNGIFDPVASIDLDWPEEALSSLAIRSIKYLGLNIPNQQILSSAAQIQNAIV